MFNKAHNINVYRDFRKADFCTLQSAKLHFLEMIKSSFYIDMHLSKMITCTLRRCLNMNIGDDYEHG